MKNAILILFVSLVISKAAIAKDIEWNILNIKNINEIEEKINERKQATDAKSQAELGILYYQLASIHKQKVSIKAKYYLESYIEKNKKPEPIILALLGSTKSMLAKETKNIIDKIKWVNRGASDLNEAVMLDPNNIKIRLTRIRVFSKLPSIFRKKKTILKDISYLLDNKLIKDKDTRNELIKINNDIR